MRLIVRLCLFGREVKKTKAGQEGEGNKRNTSIDGNFRSNKARALKILFQNQIAHCLMAG